MATESSTLVDLVQTFADVSHAASILILFSTFLRNRSAEGVSLLTQILYLVVFVTRYVDLFQANSAYVFCFKLFNLISSALIVLLMMRVFARTRERELAWKLALWSTAACLATAPFVMMIFNKRWEWSFVEFLWVFSVELESVCILPQLLLLRQTSVPTVLDSYYLVALGSYRAIYLIKWIINGAYGNHVDPEKVVFGVLQTLLYIDFAWVYYSRQRVKLRGGSVVDPDDLSKSYLVKRIIGTRSQNPEDDEVDEYGPLTGVEDGSTRSSEARAGTYWGARGVSVSADDTLDEHEAQGAAEIRDPSYFKDDDGTDVSLPPAKTGEHTISNNQHDGELGSSANQWSRD